MPAEGPQGIGPLYVSSPQFASQNCNFPICQWKSSPPPPTSIANVGPQRGTLPLCSVSSQRPLCASSAPSALSPSFFASKNQNGTVETVPPLAFCYPLAAICYLSALKTPLPKNLPPTPPTPSPTPIPYALRALAKSRSLQPFSRSSHSQPAAFVRSLAPVPQWPCNPSD